MLIQNPKSKIQNPEALRRLGRLWLHRGKIEHAIAAYQQALDLDPVDPAIVLEFGALLCEHGRYNEALPLYAAALAHHPTLDRLHKANADALFAAGSPALAAGFYQLERQDRNPINRAPADVLLCAVVRNEADRLPHFIDYYRRLGVTRFFIVDNGSTDATPALLDQPDIHLWRSPLQFSAANFGAGWFELLLRQYAIDRWCLIVDADELLTYDGCEEKSLPDLCRELQQQGKRAFSAVLLDMYSDRPLAQTEYRSGESFLAACPYFDRQYYHQQLADWGPYGDADAIFGGMRQRVFGASGAFLQSKVPLIRYSADCILSGGQHITNIPRAARSAGRGCLLHFKYFATFASHVAQEVARKQHYGAAMQYSHYAAALAANPALNLYDPQHSLRFTGSAQLRDLGIIRPDPTLASPPISPVQNPTSKIQKLLLEFPQIAPLAEHADRPLWSVMITTYNRTTYLARALSSVLAQAPAAGAMQIEVINDAADPATRAQIEAITREIGGDRVGFYSPPQHLGPPAIFNLCIQRARGQWVHILHDDDWLGAGFYAALAAATAQPEIGAAFCRHIRADEAGVEAWISPLEREQPGPIPAWLDRIAVFCRLQFAAIVVRRSVYEALGGFTPQAASAFDWDMWKRIACRYPVWYEPQPLAFFTQGPAAQTHQLIRSGQQLADARRSIELARHYLPADRAAELSAGAIGHYAAYALTSAREQRRLGNLLAAGAILRAGLALEPDAGSERAMRALLAQLP